MFSSVLANGLTLTSVALSLAASLGCGLLIAFVYKMCEHPTKGFTITLAILPAIVQLVILMVNGNLGVGVAVAGSFSLVRFRSLPGKASDILIIFLAMAIGLSTGMGFVYLALIATVILCAVYVLLAKTSIFDADSKYRNIRITIPEDVDYTEVFDDVFQSYTSKCELESVKTINLGTLYQLTYEIHLKDAKKEKEMLDQLRIRNGNLPVICSRSVTVATEL
ncbi:MAG: DUF4956 domain-containing protein [Solobacterium sp.]|nr:DUF4956 domain-containing protein [Solobacterium sp.]